MKSCRFFALATALACLTAGAASAQQPPQQGPRPIPKEEKTFPKDSSWTLRQLNGKPVPAGMEATMRIDGQFRGAGFAGCNTWSATMWPVRGQRFAVGGIVVTKKACPQPVMQFETAFLHALFSGPTWDVIGDRLEVTSQAGKLTFGRGF